MDFLPLFGACGVWARLPPAFLGSILVLGMVSGASGRRERRVSELFARVGSVLEMCIV